MKLFKLLTLLVLLSSIVTGCKKSQFPGEEITPLTITSEYKLMTPAYYREASDAASIQVRFFESPRIFEVLKSNAQYMQIKNLIDECVEAKKPLRVFFGDEKASFIPIISSEEASAQEIRDWAEKFEQTTEDVIEAKKIVPNMAKLNEIFDYCASQGCATGTATIDYCIPFQYVVDGCYARAHKMRQIMLEEYELSCEKVFSYEDVTGSLAVDAGDCCVYWWYHVAPLVTVKTDLGPVKYVIDPSMFDEPVSIAVWTAAQENHGCSPSANFGYYEITPGKIYTPGGGTDNTYSSTNWTCNWYADLETCD